QLFHRPRPASLSGALSRRISAPDRDRNVLTVDASAGAGGANRPRPRTGVVDVLPCYPGRPAARRASLSGTAIAGTGSVAAHHSAILKPGWSASTREAAAFASSIRPSFPSAAARNMWEMLKPGL